MKVEGPAAADLWQSYVQRWKAVTSLLTKIILVHGEQRSLAPSVHGDLSIVAPRLPDSRRDAGPLTGQVLRTYPNPSAHVSGFLTVYRVHR